MDHTESVPHHLKGCAKALAGTHSLSRNCLGLFHKAFPLIWFKGTLCQASLGTKFALLQECLAGNVLWISSFLLPPVHPCHQINKSYNILLCWKKATKPAERAQANQQSLFPLLDGWLIMLWKTREQMIYYGYLFIIKEIHLLGACGPISFSWLVTATTPLTDSTYSYSFWSNGRGECFGIVKP